MASDSTLRVAMDMIREELGQPDVWLGPDTRLLDLDLWDSIKTIGLILAIEQRFGFTISAHDVDTVERVVDVGRVIGIGLGGPAEAAPSPRAFGGEPG